MEGLDGIVLGELLKEIRDAQQENTTRSALLLQKADSIGKKVEEIEEDLKVISGWYPKIEKIEEHEIVLFNKKDPQKSIQWMTQDSYNNWQTFFKFRWLILTGMAGLFFTTVGMLIKQIW